MARTVDSPIPDWIYYFDTINSTNNYAMQLVDDGMAQHGTVVWAKRQVAGKGQRGKHWFDHEGNLKMSLLIQPEIQSGHQFQLSMLIALTICTYLVTILPEGTHVAIKWPNDIYVNDKKTCGILIENVFRGMRWAYAIVGIGLNVNQTEFPDDLAQATSLALVSGQQWDLLELIRDLRTGILNALLSLPQSTGDKLATLYNQRLYLKDKNVTFEDLRTGARFDAFVVEVESSGQLVLLTPSGIQKYDFGSLRWHYPPCS